MEIRDCPSSLKNSLIPQVHLSIYPMHVQKLRLKKNVGIPMKLDASKSIEKLKLSYIPLDQTVKDMVDQITSSKD